MPMYLHLNTHSAYSLLEGLPHPVELAQAASAIQRAITADHDQTFNLGLKKIIQSLFASLFGAKLR